MLSAPFELSQRFRGVTFKKPTAVATDTMPNRKFQCWDAGGLSVCGKVEAEYLDELDMDLVIVLYDAYLLALLSGSVRRNKEMIN